MSEKIYKNIFKQLSKNSNKTVTITFKLFINYFLLIFKIKNNKIFLILNNKISFIIKFIINKFFLGINMNIFLNYKNLLVEKKNYHIETLKYKKLLFHYRW